MNPTHELEKQTVKDEIWSLADGSIFEIYDRAVDHFDSGIFVELGCFYGGSAYYLAKKIHESGKDIKLYCVDLWENIRQGIGVEGNIFDGFWQNVKEYDQIIRVLQCDSADAAKLFNMVEMVFIDADHSYQGVYRDLMAWKDKCKWLAGHDYNQEVWKAVNDNFNNVENVQSMSFLIKRG